MDCIGTICGMTDPPILSRTCWTDLIHRHPSLALQAPRQGVNPFTKEPMTITPKRDQADVVVEGRTAGTMKWAKGGIQVFGEIADVGPIAQEVASVLGGRFEATVAGARLVPSQLLSAEDLAEIAIRRVQVIPAKSPLREYRVCLERVSDGDRAVAREYPDNLGMRTKLGGQPDWIQRDATPKCRMCGAWTTFVAQIDSIEHESAKNANMKEPPPKVDFMFGDVGMIYVFFCFHCLNSEAVTQFY